MNLIDAVLLLIILFSIYAGYRRGFLLGAADLLSLALGLLIAFLGFRYVAAFFDEHVPALGVWSMPLAFLLTYFLARGLLSALAGSMLRGIPSTAQQGSVNKALGVVPGAINGLINAAIVSVLLLAIPLSDTISAQTRESALAAELSPHMDWVEDQLSPVFDRAVNHSINRLTVDPGSERSISLPFSVHDPEIREDLEARMLVLVNEERAKEGLSPLKADPEMQVVARKHSRDMFARSYFSHVSPDGKTMADRAKAERVRYVVAGENLALAQTLSMAHTGLMNSPGHRANILRGAFGRVGIGILDGGRHGIMVTQNFRN